MRTANITRNTNETRIRVAVNLDGTGRQSIDTGVPSWTTCWTRSPATG